MEEELDRLKDILEDSKAIEEDNEERLNNLASVLRGGRFRRLEDLRNLDRKELKHLGFYPEEIDKLKKREKKDRARKNVYDGEEGDELGDENFQKESGYKIEPFNMKEERAQDGELDSDGKALERKRGYDAWADGEYEEQIEAYRATGKKLPASNFKNELIDDEVDEDFDAYTIKKNLYDLLLPKETVTAALRRLGKNQPKTKKTKTNSGKEEKEPETPFNLITEYAQRLLSNGFFNIYSLTKEKLMAESKSSFDELDETKAKPKTSGATWEYKGANGEMYGPYTTKQMLEWKDQGFFVGDHVVQVRQCGDGEDSPFVDSNTVDFFKFM